MGVTPLLDYGQIMISASILLGFIGFGSLVSARFHSVIYTNDEAGSVAGLYWSGFGVVASQAGVIFMVIAGWYAGAVHAALLAATLAFIVNSIRTVVRLRRIEGEHDRWRLVGGVGGPGGSGGGNGTTDAQPP